jgi:hypothetical protein
VATDRAERFRPPWTSSPRCQRLRPRQRSMGAMFRRREASAGTRRRSSECESVWPLARGAKHGKVSTLKVKNSDRPGRTDAPAASRRRPSSSTPTA